MLIAVRWHLFHFNFQIYDCLFMPSTLKKFRVAYCFGVFCLSVPLCVCLNNKLGF